MINYLNLKNCKEQLIKKRIMICTLGILMFTIFISCGTTIPAHERWEGIHNKILRVFVFQDEQNEINQSSSGLSKPDQLIEAGKTRAEIILMNFIRLHCSSVECMMACQQLVPDIISGAVMRDMKCDENSCSAIIDVNLNKLLETARHGTQH